MHDLHIAKKALAEGNYTCVLSRNGHLTTTTLRGVAPLLGWLENGIAPGFCAADKVVGRATAYLYCLLGAQAVYAQVMSRSAKGIFLRYGIGCDYETLVPHIQNRQNTGPCPMEEATADCHTPEQAVIAIRQTLARLQGQS